MYVIQIIVEYFIQWWFCHKFNVERNNPYNVSIARGISFYIDENGNKKSVDQWFSDADKKMYKDKKESRKI